MKKGFVLLIIGMCLFCSDSYSQPQIKNKKLEEFVIDLSSANVKLRGKLSLFGQYKDDLSSLTYNRYLELLKENEKTSNKGVVELIQKADQHIFATKRNSFLIAIYSKELKAVLYDDASSSFTDSIKTIELNDRIPNLNEFISKTGFKVVN